MKDRSKKLTVLNTGERKASSGDGSVRYIMKGGSGGSTGGSGGSVANMDEIAKNFLSRIKDDTAGGIIDFLMGFRVAGNLVSKLLKTDSEGKITDETIMSGARVIEEIETAAGAMSKSFLSKVMDDRTPFKLNVGDVFTSETYARLMGTTEMDDSIVNEAIHSKEFVSGFTAGKGWAIRLKEYINSAGVTEMRSVGEFDDLIVRGTMRVFEFIVSQMLGENDNRTFTGMMEVDHYDEETGKVWLDTQDGKLYNTFRKDDIILVQQYNGMPSEDNNFYVTKQYELIIDEVGVGDLSLGEDRLDWVTFRNFASPMDGTTNDIITKGDTFVRIDNLTDPNRKGIMQIMTVGEDTPYMDVIYGAKTDPDNKLKSRFGNLQGVYNPLFGWLKDFGAYIANLYAVGEFRIAHTGEDVADKIEMVKGAFRTNFSKTYFEMKDEANYLFNGSFSGDLEGWVLGESNTDFLLVGGVAVYANRNLMTANTKFAGRAVYNDMDMLRVFNSDVKQLNPTIKKFGTHKEYLPMTGGESEPSYEFVEKPDKAYLIMRFYCASDGEVEIGFDNGDTSTEALPFITMEVSKQIGEYLIEADGVWNNKGNFVIRSTADIYIEFVTLYDRPLENMQTTTETWMEQDAGRIALLGQKIDETNKSVTDLGIELDATNEQLRLYVAKTGGLETKFSQLRIDVDGITSTVTTVEGDVEQAKKIAEAAEQAAEDAAEDALAAYLEASDAYDLADEAWGYADANASTIVQHAEYISILNGRFDDDGNLINASGLVTTSEFNSLYSAHYVLEGEVSTKAEVATSVQYDPNTGEITSAVRITADIVDINNGVVVIDSNSAKIGCYEIEENRLVSTYNNYKFILNEIGFSIEHSSSSMPLFMVEAHATYGTDLQMYNIGEDRWVYLHPGNFTLGSFSGASFAIDLDSATFNMNGGLAFKNFAITIGSYATDGFYVSSASSFTLSGYNASTYKGRVLFVYFTQNCSVSGLAAGTLVCKYGTIFISNGMNWYHFGSKY